MVFKELTEEQISNFIINDPKLVYLGFSDKELVNMYEMKRYVLSPLSYYIGIEKENELVCVLKWEAFTDYCVSIHPYVASKYHGKGLLTEIYHFLWNHFITQTEIKKVIAMIPENCIHTIKACEKHGFEREGLIKKCHMWKKEMVGIVIFGLDLDSQKVK